MSQETKNKIEKLQKAIDSPATPENVKKALRTALEKLQKEIIADDMEAFKEGDLKTSAGKTVTDVKQAKAIALSEAGKSKKKTAKKVTKSPKKVAKKATKPKKSKVEPADMGKLKALINSLKNKKGYEFLKKLDIDSVKRDAERKAKKAGKRVSADGNVYYEYRRNRTDVNQKIKLAEGGEIGYEKGKVYPVKNVSKSVYEKFELSEYPNFHKTGSVSGMKKQYYGKDALLVKHGDYIYNVTSNPDIYFNN